MVISAICIKGYTLTNFEKVMEFFINNEAVFIDNEDLKLSNLKGTFWLPCAPISKEHTEMENHFFEFTDGFIFLPDNRMLIVSVCWDFIYDKVQCSITDILLLESYRNNEDKIETEEFIFTTKGNRMNVYRKMDKSREEIFLYKTFQIENDDMANPSLWSQYKW